MLWSRLPLLATLLSLGDCRWGLTHRPIYKSVCMVCILDWVAKPCNVAVCRGRGKDEVGRRADTCEYT